MARFEHPDTFVRRHIGPAPADIPEMLAELGCETLDELAAAVVPADIRLAGTLELPPPLSEAATPEDPGPTDPLPLGGTVSVDGRLVRRVSIDVT